MMEAKLSLLELSAGVMDALWQIIQVFMPVQPMFWIWSNLQWEVLHPQDPPLLHPQPQPIVDHRNGQLIIGVTMKTTMPTAIGTVGLVATMISMDGTIIVLLASALNHRPLQLQPQQHKLLQPNLLQLNLLQLNPHLQDVVPHNGLKINGVMMKIIMQIVIGTEGLVVTTMLVD